MKLKSEVPKKDMSVFIRVDDEQKKTLQRFADKFTNGNLSNWIRYAALNFEPRLKDLVKE